MEDAFHVPAASKSDRFAPLVAVPIFLVPALVLFHSGLPWLGLPLTGMALSGVWTSWRGSRLMRRGVVFDAEGVGPAEDGERLWTLAWEDYGGFRRTSAPWFDRLRRPERGGYEILARDGQPALNLLVPSQAADMPAYRAARDELRRRLPPGVPDPYAVRTRVPRPRNVAVSLVLGALFAALAAIALTHPLSPYFVWGALAAVAVPACLAVAWIEARSLRRWARGERPAPSLPPLPEEGPSAERHLARHERVPIRLEEGSRYRTVDPERRRKELREKIIVSHGSWIGVLLAAQSVYGLFVEPQSWRLLALTAVWWSLIAAVGFAALRAERALLKAVDDALWVHEGALVVVRPGEETLALPLPRASDRRALLRRGWLGATDVLRTPSGERYYLDRTRLYAAPTPEIDA